MIKIHNDKNYTVHLDFTAIPYKLHFEGNKNSIYTRFGVYISGHKDKNLAKWISLVQHELNSIIYLYEVGYSIEDMTITRNVGEVEYKNSNGKINKRTGRSYRTFLTTKELIYRLFKKKNCPICRTLLEPNKSLEYRGIGRAGHMGPRGTRYNAHIYDTKLFYFCKTCNINRSIGELSGCPEWRKEQ